MGDAAEWLLLGGGLSRCNALGSAPDQLRAMGLARAGA